VEIAPLAVIDFIAIIPYYIELIFHHDTVIYLLDRQAIAIFITGYG